MVDLHFGIFPAGVPLLHAISLTFLSLGYKVASSPHDGWSPVFEMGMMSSFSNGLLENVRMGLSSTDIVAAATTVGAGAGAIYGRGSVTGVLSFYSVS